MNAFARTFFPGTAMLALLVSGCGNATTPCSGADAQCPIDAIVSESMGTDASSPDAFDAGDASDGGSESGALGAPCMMDSDCTSGVCLSIGRCTHSCSGRMDCPTGPNWSCAGIPGRLPVCNCVPQGSTEIPCNGVDDNCDGLIDPGDTTCNGTCVDLTSSNSNCGACGIACVGGSICSHSTCVCPPTMPTICGTECLNTLNDPMHCGDCTTVCPPVPNATPVCVAGGCGATCTPGFGNCDGNMANGCETDLRTSPPNCGMCGHACSFANASATCSTGTCVMGMCNAGYSDCDHSSLTGCESMTSSDPMNCGSCGNTCVAPHATSGCTSGACSITTCDSGFANCNGVSSDGCEVSLLTDPRNCGVCSGACPGLGVANTTATCVSGVCGINCATGYANCDGNPANGCETSLQTSTHCGSCTTACPTGQICSGGTCSACPSGQAFCAGACIDVTSDVNNCGSCGHVCVTGASCVSGVCTCPSGQLACGSTCVSTGTDPNNCGGCGVVCPSGDNCVAATCVSQRFSGATGTTWETVSATGIPIDGGWTDYTPSGQTGIYATTGGSSAPYFARLDTTTNAWSAAMTYPASASGSSTFAGAAWVGSALYLLNGGTAYRYDIPSGAWSMPLTGIVTTFEAQNAHDDSGHVYAITTDDRIAVYDTVGNAVTYQPFGMGALSEPRIAWDAFTRLLFIAPDFSLPNLYSWNPVGSVITTRSTIPGSQISDTFCGDRSGHLYANGTSVGSSMFQYTVATDTWRVIPSLPFSINNTGACSVTDSGYLYVTDGSSHIARLPLM